MLILTRRGDRGESLMIYKDGVPMAEVLILSMDRNQVKIGIQAPKNVDIVRNELVPIDKLAADRNKLTISR